MPTFPLREARMRLPSRVRPGEPMGASELTKLVNEYIEQHYPNGREYLLGPKDLGRLERQQVRWPHHVRREALIAVLGVSTDADLGFTPPNRLQVHELAQEAQVLQAGVRYPGTSAQSVDLLDNLTDADLADSPPVLASGWDTTAAPGVITAYLFGDLMMRGGSPPRTGEAGVVARIRAITAHFTDLDFQFGGGQIRRMMLFYFKTEIVPLLRQHHPEPLRSEIFGAAAEVAGLLGWSAYDAGRHGAAQRYLVQGLRLAREANDHAYGACLLANLSHQANYLGEFADAVQLARAAQTAAGSAGGSAAAAMFLAMEARALASLGDGRGCAVILNRAESAFEKRSPETDPEWISYFDDLELAGEAAHCFRDLGRTRETRSFAAQAIDPARTPARTRAFIRLVDAVGALQAGHLDEALSLATDAVGLAGTLQSDRYARYLSDFRALLYERFSDHAAVRSFFELTASRTAG
jgi:hypothetical protein